MRSGIEELLQDIGDRPDVDRIERKVEWIMAAIDDLNAAVASLQSAVTGESTELMQVVNGLEAASAQIAGLQQQVAAGGSVSDVQLEQLAQSVSTVAQGAVAATDAAVAAQTPAPSPAPAPAPGPSSDQPAPAPDPTPAPAPAAPAPSLYTFDGDPTTVDQTQWAPANVQTTDTPPRPLYTYAGDGAPGDAHGDGLGGVWHLFAGQTQPAA